MSSAQIAIHAATPASRRAKIVGTLGPSCSTEEGILALAQAGVDVIRLNFSHGSHEGKSDLIRKVRKVAAGIGRPLCILADLQGPKIRTGKLKGGKPITLKTGAKLTISPNVAEGTAERLATGFATLAENVQPGSRILLSDGLIELAVTAVKGDDVECSVVNGGVLGENKGINLPGIAVNVPSLTEKDEEDLEFALEEGVDAIALSFVRTAADVLNVKQRIHSLNSDAWLIAKLEKPQAIENLDSILEVADGVMVARGDLGVEVPPEKVPAIQKHVIRRAAEHRKPVITATQMLESMIDNPRPTRAEASDVANAIYDGTDAVMLSGETAVGKYPVEAVSMMANIIAETEAQILAERGLHTLGVRVARLSISETICECMAHSAEHLRLAAIALFTESGNTARLISKYRPAAPVYALSALPHVVNRGAMLWGVQPILCRRFTNTDMLVDMAEEILLQRGSVKVRQVMGIVGGTRTLSGATNFMRLHMVGDRSSGDNSANI
jgi:pyruvate kinase